MVESLSICIIAKNSSATIQSCIESVVSLSTDIVLVLDSSSTDNTSQIVKNYPVRVITRDFKNFADQKNYAASQSKNSWVLFLDADEQVDPRLSQEIVSVLDTPMFDAYSIPRLNYIFGQPIYHTNWSPENDRHVWLYDKTKCVWVGDVHEHVKVNGIIGRLKYSKIHKNYQTVSQFLDKMNQYTSLERHHSGMLYPIWKFFRHYFLYLGFLDGWHGLFLSYLQAIYGLEVYVKSWQRKQL